MATPDIQFSGVSNQLRVALAPNSAAAFSTWPFATSLDAVIAGYPGNLVSSAQPANGSNALFVSSLTLTLASPPIATITIR